MLNTLNTKMHALSGGKPIKYSIPSEHADNCSSTGRGKSWAQIAYTEPREHALMHSMVFQDLWNLNSVDKNGRLVWNKVACRDFMRKAADIVDLIITLVHIGSGPPLRGEEIIRDQITNGSQPRSIYLSFGQILAIRRHSKDTNAKGVDPFNVCFFPQSLTDAICYYILVIRPLEKLVAQHLYQDQGAVQQYDLFLYVRQGKRMTSAQFSTTLERMTSKYVGIGLSLQPLRHILVAFQRAYVEELRVHKGDNIGDLISSHTSRTADTNYAIEHGQPEGCIASHLLKIQEWCDSYHDAIGLGDQTAPLIPLRVSRRHSRDLGSVLSTDGPREPPGKAESLSLLVKELMGTAYKSAMEDLKPFVSKELRIASSEVMEYMLASQSIPGPPATRPTKSLPLRTAPNPPPPATIPGGNTNGRAKRILSSGEHPQAKRRSFAFACPDTNQPTMTPVYPNPDFPPTYPEELADVPLADTEGYNPKTTSAPLQIVDTTPEDQRSPASEPSTEPHPTFPAPTDLQIPDVEGESTIARFGLMSITSHQVEGQVGFQVVDQARFQADRIESKDPITPADRGEPVDRVIQALQTLRRDPCAAFKSLEQRKLIDSVLSGNHTIGVLPTGGGKSIAYELPPVYHGQVTIAAFPFRVIAGQAAQTCSDRGIPFEHWTSNDLRFIVDTRLVIVAIETLLSDRTLK